MENEKLLNIYIVINSDSLRQELDHFVSKGINFFVPLIGSHQMVLKITDYYRAINKE